jgi:3-dehydroquinate synthetase
MDLAARIARRLCLLPLAAFDRHQAIIARLQQHTSAIPVLDVESILLRLSHDAKAVLNLGDDRCLPFVLLRDLGRPAATASQPFIAVSAEVVRELLIEAFNDWLP